MKKIYALLTLLGLFLFGAIDPATAQDEVTLTITAKTGDWTAAGSPKYASEYATASQNPGVRIQHWSRGGDHRNNMWFYDDVNLGIYSAFGSTESEDYRIYPSAGWYVKKVSLDFVTGVHPNFADPAGVQVYVNGGEPAVSYGTEDLAHYEIDDLDPEEPYAVLTIAQVDKPAFANTSNFTITLKKQDALIAAWAEFTEAFNKYSALNPDDFPAGTEPGCYDEAAVTAFFAAVDAAAAIDEIEDPDAITIEQLETATKAMNDAYEAMIATKVLYQVANGYYRFRTGMQYQDGNTKYLMSYTLDQTKNAYWGTPGDAEDNLAAIWTITKSGDDYDVVSVMSNARFATVGTSTAATLTQDTGTLMAIEAVGTDGTDTFINMRLTTAASGGANYVHQNGHGGGANSSGNIVGWYSTFSSGNPAASEWVLEPVDESEVQQLKSEYQTWKTHQDLVNSYTPLFKTAVTELAKSQDDVEGDALITSADQFSSEWSDSDEGQDFGALIDDDASTYWHTDWHNGSVPNHSHWLQVDLSDASYSLVRMTIVRRAVTNDHITRWGVFGSDDPDAAEEDWTEVATLFTPYGSNTETISGLVFDGKGFKHLRFYIDGTSSGRGYGHMSNFQLYKVESLDGSAFAAVGAAATTLESTIQAQKDIANADLTQNDYNTLKSAYDAFHAKFSDPTEMRELIQQAEEFAAGIVAGDNPGQWSDTSAADALKSTITAAKAYDAAGSYDPTNTANYVNTLTSQMDAVKAAANQVQTGKWYRIRFGTEEEFNAGGWDLVAGEATESDPELWGKYATVGKYDEGSIEPIDLADVRMGTRIHFLEKTDIPDEDMALYRFVDCGDKGYLLQNKSTGLFLKAAGTSGAVTLSIVPSFFSATALGYGQNLIAAKDMAGNAQSYLHAQVAQNVLVTYNAYTLGSRSGLYLEEAGDASGLDEAEFDMDIIPGRFYSFCYPVDLSTTEGKMLTVSSAEGTTVNLTSVSQAAAGEPFIYLYGELSDYSTENTAEAITFKHGITIAEEPKTDGAIKGTYVSKEVGQGYIVVSENNPNTMTVTRQLLGGTVPAYSAYIQSTESLSYTADITIVIDGEVVIDDVRDLNATLSNVYTNGKIYTLDGRLVSRNGNIDDARRLGRGIYIINGVKVAVK